MRWPGVGAACLASALAAACAASRPRVKPAAPPPAAAPADVKTPPSSADVPVSGADAPATDASSPLVEDHPTPFAFSTGSFSVAPATAPARPFQWRRLPRPFFAEGETIRYVIKYGFMSGGHVALEVRSTETVRGRAALRVVSVAQTNGVMDVMFKVRDINESWMDLDSLCSLRYRQSMREGFYRREVESLYDHPAGRFRYWKSRKGKETVVEGGIPPFVQDVLSGLYYIRTRDLTLGESYSLDANSGAETWPLIVHVRRKKTIKVPAGRFDCLVLEPVMTGEGIFDHRDKGDLQVYVTDDARKIPVLLRSRVMVGSFTADMTYYSGGGIAYGDPRAPRAEVRDDSAK
jgi:hypothetical protein